MLGPFRGGRTDAVCGVHGRPNEFYFGAVNGGVWKTVDAGRVWEPVFDSQPVASIGALAVAPSAPDTVYVGSGESTLRDSTGFGNGMYKSTDAGKTWLHIGLDDTQHIGKSPYAQKSEHRIRRRDRSSHAASPERGVFGRQTAARRGRRSSTGRKRRRRRVVIDPVNPQVSTQDSGIRDAHRYTYAPTNGPGGGIFKSTAAATRERLQRPAEGRNRQSRHRDRAEQSATSGARWSIAWCPIERAAAR